jgi:hypothetical protein
MPSAKSPAAITVTHKPSPSRSIAVRQPIHSRKVSSQEVKPPWSVERLAFCRNLSENTAILNSNVPLDLVSRPFKAEEG